MRIQWLTLSTEIELLITVYFVIRVQEYGMEFNEYSFQTSRYQIALISTLTIQNISLLGRDLKQCIIIDNNPQCYQLHPQHAVPISSWFEDHLDVELLTMIPLLQDLARDDVEDVRDVLCQDFHDNILLQ